MEFSSSGGDFARSLEDAVGADRAQAVLAALDGEASVSVRLNPFKTGDGTPDIAAGAAEVPWNRHGRFLDRRPSFTLDPVFHAGAYYVQDSSAMAPGHCLRSVLPDMDRTIKVLDLCAAPGGKTTDLAASLRERYGSSFLLVANEAVRQRSSVLCGNVALWGDPNVAVTSADPAAFAAYEGFFDVILADVPCSGEGMFRKDGDARRMWSGDNVALCEARQRRIIGDVWPALAPGGILVYSTCTFNSRENDGNAVWVAQALGAEPLMVRMPFDGILETEYGVLLMPGLVRGEGQYCAVLRKDSGRVRNFRPGRPRGKRHPSIPGLFSGSMVFEDRGGMIFAVPEAIVPELEAVSGLGPLMTGTAVGELKGGKLVPHPDLALSIDLCPEAFRQAELDRSTALSFLHGDSIRLDAAERGILLLRYKGYGLGFVNNLGNRCNNLLPRGRRIKMSI